MSAPKRSAARRVSTTWHVFKGCSAASLVGQGKGKRFWSSSEHRPRRSGGRTDGSNPKGQTR